MQARMADPVLEELARRHTQNGDLESALSLAKSIDQENAREVRLHYIAQAQIQAGNLRQAASTAD